MSRLSKNQICYSDLLFLVLGAFVLSAGALSAADFTPQAAAGSAAPAQANSDVNYRALRDGTPAETYHAENIVLKRDVCTLTLKSGEISFLPAVLGQRTMAVFTGVGRFELKPATPIEESRLAFVTGARTVDEELESVLLLFTDATFEEVKGQAKEVASSTKNVAELERFRNGLRSRTENPRSTMESLLNGDSVPNLEASLLAELYNPAHRGSFTALIHGKKHSHLRFVLAPQGAVPDLGPEEVAVLNLDPLGNADGIWYLAHTQAEIAASTASSSEEKRIVAPLHYEIDATVGRRDRLAAKVKLDVRALRDGDRVIGLNLLPDLRVSLARLAGGANLAVIQESRKQDGALHLILPEPTKQGRLYTLEITYEGNKVIADEGSGNYSVDARENWYPNVSPFRDWATYDIKFHSPKKLTLVSVGKLVSEKKEGDEIVTQWMSEKPMPVAGFNYGNFKRKDRSDDVTQYALEAYATADPPDYLRSSDPEDGLSGYRSSGADSGSGMNLSPSSMADTVLVDAQNSVRVFTQWFGAAPFGRLAVTQQPAFSFGQSWPTLVYLPVSAFLDSTTRWRLLGKNAFRFSSEFIDVVTAHEVAHQWWGHTVSWASYHDQWLSEGFSDFSASLFLEATQSKSGAYQKYWDSERKQLLEKNQYGHRANDVGPIWMGSRLNSTRAPGAYQKVIYSKGAWVLQMLRAMMHDASTGDKDFIAMMRDFVATHTGKCASTEDFQRIVEKHMKPVMNMNDNGRMDWFFREWVYGTEVPSYQYDYTVADLKDGKSEMTLKITQKDVSNTFEMPVAVYGDFDGRVVKLGVIPLRGSASSGDVKVTLPKRPRRILINVNNDILASSTTQG
jgi:hypothetical protein